MVVKDPPLKGECKHDEGRVNSGDVHIVSCLSSVKHRSEFLKNILRNSVSLQRENNLNRIGIYSKA